MRVAALVAVLSLGGCATITTGTTQPINVDSEPQEAECTLLREGQVLSTVTTPAPVTIKRNANTLHVVCKKAGYEDGRVVMNSRHEMASAGNALLGGIIGAMVDASTGANSRYEPYVMVRLTPLSPAEQAAAAARAKADAAAKPVPVAAAAAPPAPTPFDGEYHGGFQVGPFSDSLRTVELRVSAGEGTGTVRQQRCSTPGPISLKISPSGAVTGEVDVLATGTCNPVKGRIEGRAEGDLLKLTFTDGGQPREFSLRRAGKTG